MIANAEREAKAAEKEKQEKSKINKNKNKKKRNYKDYGTEVQSNENDAYKSRNNYYNKSYNNDKYNTNYENFEASNEGYGNYTDYNPYHYKTNYYYKNNDFESKYKKKRRPLNTNNRQNNNYGTYDDTYDNNYYAAYSKGYYNNNSYNDNYYQNTNSYNSNNYYNNKNNYIYTPSKNPKPKYEGLLRDYDEILKEKELNKPDNQPILEEKSLPTEYIKEQEEFIEENKTETLKAEYMNEKNGADEIITAVTNQNKENINFYSNINKPIEDEEKINVNKVNMENLRSYFDRLKQHTFLAEHKDENEYGLDHQYAEFNRNTLPVFQNTNLQSINQQMTNLANNPSQNTKNTKYPNLSINNYQFLEITSGQSKMEVEYGDKKIMNFSLFIPGNKSNSQENKNGNSSITASLNNINTNANVKNISENIPNKNYQNNPHESFPINMNYPTQQYPPYYNYPNYSQYPNYNNYPNYQNYQQYPVYQQQGNHIKDLISNLFLEREREPDRNPYFHNNAEQYNYGYPMNNPYQMPYDQRYHGNHNPNFNASYMNLNPYKK